MKLINVLVLIVILSPLLSYASHPDHSAYGEALAQVNWAEVKDDIKAVLNTSQGVWPADFGNYGPFMIRYAWHCAGSYRRTDGRGGCNGGRIRFPPEKTWMDNGNLDQAEQLLQPIKQKHGLGLSWGDLIILTGTVAIESMGGPNFGFCAGRIDDDDGSDSNILNAITCDVPGDCTVDESGATTVGLIYVNPEGPQGVPNRTASAPQIRDTFSRMDMNDTETVALVGGGHAFGKAHGACTTPPCGTGMGPDTVTSGFEGPWTTTPTTWSNQYFNNLLDYNWTVWTGPGGHYQWRKDDNTTDIMMLTADLALLEDPVYLDHVLMYAANLPQLTADFGAAWYKLVTRDMGPHERCAGPWVPPPQPFQNPLPPSTPVADWAPIRTAVEALINADNAGSFVELAYQCATSYRRHDNLGGCNGARVRFSPQADWPELAGSDQVLALLQPVKNAHVDLTWADLIVLAGHVALDNGVAGPQLPFCPNRTDDTDGSALTHVRGKNNYDGTAQDIWNNADTLGLDIEEYVALMARLRSPAQMARIGYSGTWAVDPTVLSNEYFVTLKNESWVSTFSPANKTQFKAVGKELYMVPSDLALLDDGALEAIVDAFIVDEELFLETFAHAWISMMAVDRYDGPTGNLCELEYHQDTNTTTLQGTTTPQGTTAPQGTTSTPATTATGNAAMIMFAMFAMIVIFF